MCKQGGSWGLASWGSQCAQWLCVCVCVCVRERERERERALCGGAPPCPVSCVLPTSDVMAVYCPLSTVFRTGVSHHLPQQQPYPGGHVHTAHCTQGQPPVGVLRLTAFNARAQKDLSEAIRGLGSQVRCCLLPGEGVLLILLLVPLQVVVVWASGVVGRELKKRARSTQLGRWGPTVDLPSRMCCGVQGVTSLVQNVREWLPVACRLGSAVGSCGVAIRGPSLPWLCTVQGAHSLVCHLRDSARPHMIPTMHAPS
jgi:hypothetical protein